MSTTSSFRSLGCAALAGALIACACAPAPDHTIADDVVGVSITVPDGWFARRDPVLFETHGFLLYAPDDGHAEAVARVALAYDARPGDVEALVATKLASYAELAPERRELVLPDGRAAVAVTGLPGTSPYSVVYTVDGDRVYEIGLWSDEPGLDDRALDLLGRLRFHAPAREVAALGLARPEEALYGEPPPALLPASRIAADARRIVFELAAAADPDLARAAREEVLDPPLELSGDRTASTCGVTAPKSLYWQLQWDGTNTFYSGSWYRLRSRPGWSAMSGNYGSWWGTNFHIWRCSGYYLNQWYANDWPAQHWANAYAAFSGYVEWAGWGTDGYASLGRYVVVRNGQYRSLTAHLMAIRPGITWGAWIDGYWTVIGYAGDTGETYAGTDWAPHLHARVGWGESLTFNGQPYGGQSVQPLRLRCFTCNDADAWAAGGSGGWYTRFWHGRWMKY